MSWYDAVKEGGHIMRLTGDRSGPPPGWLAEVWIWEDAPGVDRGMVSSSTTVKLSVDGYP